MNTKAPTLKQENIDIIEVYDAKIYPLEPIGAKIYGIDLSTSENLPKELIDALEKEMASRGFIVFKEQKELSVEPLANSHKELII